MIISFWFRDINRKGEAHPTQPAKDVPNIQQWPQGWFGGPSNAPGTMVPPNGQYALYYDPEYHCKNTFYNPYGMPIGGLILGDLFLGAACVWIPNAPPVVTNTWDVNPGVGILSGIAAYDMVPNGIRTMITFGDTTIPYKYAQWETWDPGVMKMADYTWNAILASGGIFTPSSDPGHPQPPPYFVRGRAVCDGLYDIVGWKIGGSVTKGTVPQSFIGLDNDGHIIINLQCKEFATYEGYAWQESSAETFFASQSYFHIWGPPYSYDQIGWPFPDGNFYLVEGYWNGYWFYVEDISQQVMGGCPESFVVASTAAVLGQAFDFIYGIPTVSDGGWHHILFSFDISGGVDIVNPSYRQPGSTVIPIYSGGAPIVNKQEPHAWLSLDDVNLAGNYLQKGPPCHDGWLLPKLLGTETTQLLDCGPTGCYRRGGDPNHILPRNAWLRGWAGNPKDDLRIQECLTPVIDTTSWDPQYSTASYCDVNNCTGDVNGDYATTPHASSQWILYGGCDARAPGPWHGENHPKKPYQADWYADLADCHYKCDHYSIPIKGHPISLPGMNAGPYTPMGANTEYNNTGIEMAELQIWVGKTIDTSSVRQRRLFIDWPKDKNGNPDKSRPMEPVSPSVAAAALGEPDIMLHGTNNWLQGKNTGTSGYIIFPDGSRVPNPRGQFEVLQDVEKFLPDPKLNQ
jgi:hypothetical protein